MLWSSTVNIFAISDRPTLQMYKDIQILKSSKQARSQMQKRQAPTESKKIHTRQAKTQNYRSVMLGSLIQAQFIPILNSSPIHS